MAGSPPLDRDRGGAGLPRRRVERRPHGDVRLPHLEGRADHATSPRSRWSSPASGSWRSRGPRSATSSATSPTARRSRSWPTSASGSSPRSSRWRPAGLTDRPERRPAGPDRRGHRDARGLLRPGHRAAGRGCAGDRVRRPSSWAPSTRSWAWRSSRSCVGTGVVLPLVSRRLSRAAAVASVASRGELTAMIVDEIGGIADLIALDRAAAHRERVLALGAELDRATDRLAMVRAATDRAGGAVREPGRGHGSGDRGPARRRGTAGRRLPRRAAARRGRLLRGHRAALPGLRAPGRQRGGRAPAVRADRCGAGRGRGDRRLHDADRPAVDRRTTRPARPPSRSATSASATRRTSRGCSTG